jgi:heptosyltransferase-3
MTRQRLLMIHPGALGDVITAFPAIVALRKHFAFIGLMCQSHIGFLAHEIGLVDTCIALESAGSASLYGGSRDPGLVAEISAYGDIVVLSRNPALAQHIAEIAPGRVQFITPRPEPAKRVHVTDHLLAALARNNLIEGHKRPEADDLRHPIAAKETLLHPGSGSLLKNWPLEQFQLVANLLRNQGIVSRWLLGPAEMHLAQDLRSGGQPLWCPETTAELLKGLRNVQGWIGNDSGVSHLAGFLGLATVAIFGPSDPLRWQPFGRAVAMVGPEPASCLPCFETGRVCVSDGACFRGITAQRVVSAYLGLDR